MIYTISISNIQCHVLQINLFVLVAVILASPCGFVGEFVPVPSAFGNEPKISLQKFRSIRYRAYKYKKI